MTTRIAPLMRVLGRIGGLGMVALLPGVGPSRADCPNQQVSSTYVVFDSFINESFGGATLSLVNGNTNLAVDNMGSSGSAGVRQYVPQSTDMATGLACPNFLASILGSRMQAIQIGHVDGNPNQTFSALTVENVGGQLQITGDWSYIGTTEYTIEVLTELGGSLVTSQGSLSSGVVFTPVTDVDTVDCKINPPCELTFELTGEDPPTIPIPTVTIPGRGTFAGRYVRIIAANSTQVPDDQTEIVMYGKDLGTLVITDESTTPPPSCPTIVPALSRWGIGILAVLLAGSGFWVKRSMFS